MSCVPRQRSTATTLTLAVAGFFLLIKECSNISLATVLPVVVHTIDGPVATDVPAIGGIFYTGGKFLVAVLSQAIGPRALLSIAFFCVTFGTLLCAMANGYSMLLVGWCLTQFGSAEVWVAAYGLAVGWVNRAYIGRGLAIVFAVSNDGGGIVGSLVFSYLLNATESSESWRLVFYLVSALAACACLVTTGPLRNTAEQAGFAPVDHSDTSTTADQPAAKTAPVHSLANAPLTTAFSSFARNKRFWLTLVSSCAFTLSYMTMQTYAALYATRRLGTSPSTSARLVSKAAAGSLLGGCLGGIAIDSLHGMTLVMVSATYKLIAVASAGLWLYCDMSLAAAATDAHATPVLEPETMVSLVSVTLFLVFGSVAFTWNPVVSRAAAAIGGTKHAATVVGIADVTGFICRVPFSYAFGLMLESPDDISKALTLWVVVLVIAHISAVALILFEEMEVGVATSSTSRSELM